jgi:tryptophan-rich sensory protein
MIEFKKLIISILIPLLVGGISSIFTINSIPNWYSALAKPGLTPPNWLFGPAWILLYILMGISLYLVWKKGFRNKKVKIGIYFFSAQLILNFLWTALFFGAKNPLFASIEIVFLWVTILITIIKFYKVSKEAAYLLIPYILWVTFASYLSFSVFFLNT